MVRQAPVVSPMPRRFILPDDEASVVSRDSADGVRGGSAAREAVREQSVNGGGDDDTTIATGSSSHGSSSSSPKSYTYIRICSNDDTRMAERYRNKADFLKLTTAGGAREMMRWGEEYAERCLVLPPTSSSLRRLPPSLRGRGDLSSIIDAAPHLRYTL